MTLRHKRPRPLDRPELHRDARLFVIASEDTYAAKQYFEESPVFRDRRIYVLTLPTECGQSAPEHVLQRLKAYREDKKRRNELLDEDEFWLMLDTDHWTAPSHITNFNQVCGEALQQRIGLAHSNPCFEVWILLHFDELNASDQFRKGHDVEKRLRASLGQYNKTRLDLARFNRENAAAAAERAERLDTTPENRWPQKTGTHVYRLVKNLFAALHHPKDQR